MFVIQFSCTPLHSNLIQICTNQNTTSHENPSLPFSTRKMFVLLLLAIIIWTCIILLDCFLSQDWHFGWDISLPIINSSYPLFGSSVLTMTCFYWVHQWLSINEFKSNRQVPPNQQRNNTAKFHANSTNHSTAIINPFLCVQPHLHGHSVVNNFNFSKPTYWFHLLMWCLYQRTSTDCYKHGIAHWII